MGRLRWSLRMVCLKLGTYGLRTNHESEAQCASLLQVEMSFSHRGVEIGMA